MASGSTDKSGRCIDGSSRRGKWKEVFTQSTVISAVIIALSWAACVLFMVCSAAVNCTVGPSTSLASRLCLKNELSNISEKMLNT